MPIRTLCIAGARPNFIKMAPLLTALRARPDEFAAKLVHTGQHYDTLMSDVFFSQLGIAPADISLGIGAGSAAEQTGAIMMALERLLGSDPPDLVVVVGDVTSTLAAALCAARTGIPVAHVEAGLRSFDRHMPEEINRVVTDVLASIHFVTEQAGVDNLLAEGVDDDGIHLVGNVMIDTLLSLLPRIRQRSMAAELGLVGGYGVVTLHRPSNVDDPLAFARLIDALTAIAADLPLVFPVHPRTRARMRASELDKRLTGSAIRLTDPLPYVEFMSLILDATAVLTDSGGIQEETTALGVPCLTLRDNTERPVTVALGTNTLVGADPSGAVAGVRWLLDHGPKAHAIPPLWDGRTATRIVDILSESTSIHGGDHRREGLWA